MTQPGQAEALPAARNRASKSIYALGEAPPLGVIPELMHAVVVRQSRYGMPATAMQLEVVPVPQIGPHQVLVRVMAAGVNYNGVWASYGMPVDVIAKRMRAGAPEDFHIPGSDGSGIVWAVGSAVRRVKAGDHVVLCPAKIDPYAEDIVSGCIEQTLSSSLQAWGYETNYGAFAQYTVVDDYQCFPKPARLGWAESASYMLCGGTAYRQLMGWQPNTVQPGDPVLIWGGAGALGSMAIQIVRQAGGIPIAVVSSDDKAEHCLRLGAKGVINRNDYKHWGRLADLNDQVAFKSWLDQVRAFGQKFWDVLGQRQNPRIVFEHSGAATIPTSMYLCDQGGMVVTCGATSGFNGDVDMRFLWMRQKRLQGSHGASMRQYQSFNSLIASGAIDPCLTRVVDLTETASLHELMLSNRHAGNLAVLVGAAGENS